MKLSDYQEWSNSTAVFPVDCAFEYIVIALCGEVGEVANKAKKLIRDGTYIKEDFISELGDVFWYLVQLCEHLHIDAETVLDLNKEKLEDRMKRNVLKGSGDHR